MQERRETLVRWHVLFTQRPHIGVAAAGALCTDTSGAHWQLLQSGNLPLCRYITFYLPPSPPLHLPLNLSVSSFSLFLSSTTAIRRTQQKRRIVWFPFCKSSVSFNQTCILHCRLSESWRSKRINATLMPATIYLVSIFIRNDSIPRHEFRQEFVSGEQIRLVDEKIATNILTGLGTWIWQFFRSVLRQNGKWKIGKKMEFWLVTKFWTRFCWTFEEWKLVKERFGGYFCTEVEMIIIF